VKEIFLDGDRGGAPSSTPASSCFWSISLVLILGFTMFVIGNIRRDADGGVTGAAAEVFLLLFMVVVAVFMLLLLLLLLVLLLLRLSFSLSMLVVTAVVVLVVLVVTARRGESGRNNARGVAGIGEVVDTSLCVCISFLCLVSVSCVTVLRAVEGGDDDDDDDDDDDGDDDADDDDDDDDGENDDDDDADADDEEEKLIFVSDALPYFLMVAAIGEDEENVVVISIGVCVRL
jgi:Ca2+/Na+ antiporter